MSEENQQSGGALDTVKLIVALGLLVAGIAGFYLLADQAAYVRWPALIVAAIAAVAVFGMTSNGSTILGYVRGSRTEVRKMVWPTRQETIRTTITIFIVVVLLALFLALVDSILLYLVRLLTGQGG